MENGTGKHLWDELDTKLHELGSARTVRWYFSHAEHMFDTLSPECRGGESNLPLWSNAVYSIAMDIQCAVATATEMLHREMRGMTESPEERMAQFLDPRLTALEEMEFDFQFALLPIPQEEIAKIRGRIASLRREDLRVPSGSPPRP